MSAGRGENEQKISDLEKRVKDLEEHKDRTDNTVRGLKRRVDRMDKSTQVVIENHQDLEKIYQDAETLKELQGSIQRHSQGRPSVYQHLDGIAVPHSRIHC